MSTGQHHVVCKTNQTIRGHKWTRNAYMVVYLLCSCCVGWCVIAVLVGKCSCVSLIEHVCNECYGPCVTRLVVWTFEKSRCYTCVHSTTFIAWARYTQALCVMMVWSVMLTLHDMTTWQWSVISWPFINLQPLRVAVDGHVEVTSLQHATLIFRFKLCQCVISISTASCC